MQPTFRSYLLLLLFFSGICFPVNIYTQKNVFLFQRIGMNAGLPARMVYDLVQDETGFIWISTQLGIHRYDGYRFKTWANSELNLPERIPAHLALDGKNRLWYSTRIPHGTLGSGGVLDLETEKVRSMKEISGGRIDFKEVKGVFNPDENSQEVLIAMASGIYFRYDGSLNELFRINNNKTFGLDCKKSSDGSYWLGGKATLYCLSPNKLIPGVWEKRLMLSRDRDSIASFYLDSTAMINRIDFVEDRPIIRLSSDLANITLIDSEWVPLNLPNISDKGVRDIIKAHPDFCIYTTKDSILITDPSGNKLGGQRFAFAGNDEKELKLFGYLYDNQNNLWIGTENGIYKISIRKNPFKILKNRGAGELLVENSRLWKESFPQPMMEELNGPNFLPYPMEGRSLHFTKDDKERVWAINSKGNLSIYDPDLTMRKFTLSGIQDYYFIPYIDPQNGHLWLGGKFGLYRTDLNEDGPTTGTLERFSMLPDPGEFEVRQFYRNDEGIWVVTSKGLFLIDGLRLVRHYCIENGFPIENLNYLYESQDGIFWLASRGSGLFRWDRTDSTFRQFSSEDGLSNNMIYAIYEDEYENLWLPSDFGLMAFDKNTFITKLYLPHDGIANEEFNTFSHCKDKDGNLYFGGLGGITIFHPSEINNMEKTDAPLLVTRIQVLKKGEHEFQDATFEWKEKNEIILGPGDRILNLELTLLDFENSAKNQYAYQVPGYQDNWNFTNSNNISLINLPFGQHELRIKARDASGNWTEQNLSIPIFVKSPFYRKTWFIITTILLGLALIITLALLRIRSLKREQERLENEVEKRTIEIKADREVIALQAKELQELDEVKSRFFANITHEFRTPLTLIMGPVEQCIKQSSESHVRKQLINVHQNSRNLLELINQLLDLSKLESKKMTTEFSMGEIVGYTEEIVMQFLPLAQLKLLKLIFHADPDHWEIYFDKGKWNKAVTNLLSNAIKFSPIEGKIEVSIKRILDEDSEFIELRVNDRGLGIAEKHLDQIFNRFYQINDGSTRLQGGTGIGLALVKELIEFQGGEIKVESTVGEGTLFIIKLPVRAPGPEGISSDLSFPRETEGTQEDQGELFNQGLFYPTQIVDLSSELTHFDQSSSRLQILLIEDNAELRAFIRSCLNETTYKILEATNGEEGINKAIKYVPDLIISDIMMPKKDGYQVTQTIRQHLATSHIPLILLTARAALSSRLEGFRRGADAYLSKPFSPEELVLRIEKLIEMRRALQQRFQTLSPNGLALGDPSIDQGLPNEFASEDIFIISLKEFIEENLGNQDLSPEMIGTHFGLSRSQLYRKVKSLTSITIAELSRNMRLEKSVELMDTTNLSLSEIAFELGFSSLSYFSRAFKNHFGKSPSESRNT